MIKLIKRYLYKTYVYLRNKYILIKYRNKKISSFPDFLCIGAQKSGTSWIFENLRIHHQVYIPQDRYLHYFDRNLHKSFSRYLGNFLEGKDKVKGEIIPGYGLISIERIKFLQQCNPDLKIILIMRNPVERAWSHAIMHYTKFKGLEIDSISDQELIDHFNSSLSRTKGDYLSMIENWESVFPSSSFLYCFYDEIKSNPKILLNKIFSFLHVEKIQDFTNYKIYEKINIGASSEIPEHLKKYLYEMYDDQLINLHKRFDENVSMWREI